MNQISVTDNEWTVTMTFFDKLTNEASAVANTDASPGYTTNRFKDKLDSFEDLDHWMRANLTAYEIAECRQGLLAFAPNGVGLEGATIDVLKDFYEAFKKTFDTGERVWIVDWKQDIQAFNETWVNWSQDDIELALKVSDVISDVADYDSVCHSEGYNLLCDAPESIEDVMSNLTHSTDTTLHEHWKAIFDRLALDAADDEDFFEEVFMEMIETDILFKKYCYKHYRSLYKKWKASA